LAKTAGGLTPEQFGMTVQDFVSSYCVGSINGQRPGQLLGSLVQDVLAQAKSANAAAKKCKKLLNADRFRK
jgi:hypothetical protein